MMLRKVQGTAVLFFVALLIAALACSAALAVGRVGVGSRVALAQSDPFHGKVLSGRDACERNRTVAVYLVRPGADGLYDTTSSNALGEWSIPAGTSGGSVPWPLACCGDALVVDAQAQLDRVMNGQ